jgi:hypothetical protein
MRQRVELLQEKCSRLFSFGVAMGVPIWISKKTLQSWPPHVLPLDPDRKQLYFSLFLSPIRLKSSEQNPLPFPFLTSHDIAKLSHEIGELFVCIAE